MDVVPSSTASSAPSLQKIADWFTTGSGRIVAAMMLLTLVYAVRFFPGVLGKRLQEGWQQRALAGLFAISPSLALGLVTDVPFAQLLTTSFLAFASATGLHHVAADMVPALSTGASKVATNSPEFRAAVHRVLTVTLKGIEDEIAKRVPNTYVTNIVTNVDPEKAAAAIEAAVFPRNPGSGESTMAPGNAPQSPQDEPGGMVAPIPHPDPPSPA